MNKTIEKIENQIEKWLSHVPRLPDNYKKWLATNLWIIVLVGTILSGIAIITMLFGLISIISMLGAVSSLYLGYYATAYSGWSVVTSIVSIVLVAGTVALMAMAINPLKASKKAGWRLMFYSLLLQAAAVVINAVLSLNIISIIFGIVFGAVGVAIGAYLLFEVKSHFVATGKVVDEKKEQKTE